MNTVNSDVSKIHVCHVLSGYHRNDPRIFHRQCKSMLSFGYSVSIITNDGLPDEIVDEIHIKCINSKYSSRAINLLFAKFQFIKLAIEMNADVYQLHSPELISLGIALKKRGKKVIYDAHEDMPRHILEKHWIPTLLRKIVSRYVEFYMRYYLKKYDGIISPHQHVVDDLLTINDNVELITNFAIVKEKIEVSREQFYEKLNILCYSGTCYLHSNQIQILNAIADMNVNYWIAGSISPNLYSEMEKNKSFEKIKYFGRLSWEKLDEFYSNCGVGMVVLDYKMNWGGKKGTYAVNKMFEYMEASLPIICSDYEMWKEVIEKYNCGLYVEPGNVDQISKAIHFMLSNPDQAFKMGQNGRKAIIEEYNWEKEEQKYFVFCSKIFNQ